MKTKHHFPYTIVSTPHARKQLHESEYNSHESDMVPLPTTYSILTQKSRLLIANYSFVKIFLL